jgi:PKD repeat protein
LDPAVPSALYVLVEFSGSTPGYSLMRVQGDTKTLIGSFPIPSVAGEQWSAAYTSALITGGSNVYVLMWANRSAPSTLYRLYSTTVSSFGSTPGAIDFDPGVYSFFGTGYPMRGFASSDGTVNAYMATDATAYALSLSCRSSISKAAADMTVTNGATQLADGATVFLGDTIAITPTVSPSGASQAITSWGFDFDFHAGAAFDDNGASVTPRLKVPDLSGSGTTPPDRVTLVGPCDPNVAGTDPGSGVGCWASVKANSVFAGGSPDFTGAELAGATKQLSFAFEASNSLGSAGAKVFSLKWQVPAVRLLSSQVLLGNAISSGADGHPAPSGFKWYFGSTNTAPAGEQMIQDTSCTGATCTHHLFPGKGTFNVWLTVPYANGYTTPDCANPCLATGASLTVNVTDVVLAFTAPALVPVKPSSFSVVNYSTVSQSVTKIGNGYFYCVKRATQSCSDQDYSDLLANGTGPILTPDPDLNYWLRIRFNYTIAGITQPPAQWTPSAPGVSDNTAWPFTVSSQIPEIRFNCEYPGFPCSDFGTISVNAGSTFTAYAYVGGGQDNSTAISWSAPGAAQGSGSTQNGQTFSYSTAGTYTLTLNGYGAPYPATITVKKSVTPPTPLSVSASAYPTSATTGTPITFSCSASGGTPGYTYSWSGAVSGSSSSVSTSFSSAGNYSATCTVTDAASRTAFNTARVTITDPGSGGGGGGGNVEIRFNCESPGFPCSDFGTIGVNAGSTFTAYAYVGGGQYSGPISWSAPGAAQGNGSTQNGQTFSYSTAGTYTLTLNGPATVNATITVAQRAGGGGGGGSSCADVDFKVFDAGLEIRANQFGVIPVLANESLSFTANPNPTPFASYDWDFGDGTPHGSGATATHTFLSGGYPTVKLTVPANGTCKTLASHDLWVKGPVGPTGIFTAKYADNSPFLATKVASGKAVSFVATDTADTYTWDFGDGTSPVFGQTPSHTYVTPGSTAVTYTVTLTVRQGTQNASTTQSFTILPPPEPPKWFVAGMAYLQGSLAGTVWQSDVTVFNPDPSRPGTYSLAFLDGRNPVDPANLVWTTIKLGAQQSISSSNILPAFFGQPLGSFGAVLVRGDSAPVPPVLTARTFNIGDPTKGTFGSSVPSTQPSSGLTSQAALAQQFLIGLRDDDTAYTNLGLMNLTTDWSHARLTFLDSSGATLTCPDGSGATGPCQQVNVDVPPYGVAQLTRPLATAPPNGVGFPDPLDTFSVRVTVLSGGVVFPYATVIDRRSTDSIVVTASDRPSSAYRMPGIIRLQGANNTVWRSRFYITNPSTTSRKASISYSFVPCDAIGCKSRITGLQSDVTLLPGETLRVDDFPKVWLAGFGFGVSDTTAYQSSYVDVSPAAGDPNQEPLLVLGETYNDQPTGPVGLQVPGFTDADAASKTGAYKRLLLSGLVSNASYRTNVALFLQSGASGRCTVRVLSDAGVELAHQDIGFSGATTFVQLNDLVLFGSLPGNKDRLAVVIDSFDGSPISAYATIVDNTSGDATFLKAQPAP